MIFLYRVTSLGIEMEVTPHELWHLFKAELFGRDADALAIRIIRERDAQEAFYAKGQ